jgi:hypothetical protein
MWGILTWEGFPVAVLDSDWQKTWLAYLVLSKGQPCSFQFLDPAKLPAETQIRSLNYVWLRRSNERTLAA